MAATDRTLRLHGSLWLSVDGEKFGGEQRIALLGQIAESGSITRAAKAIGLSYKAAWDAIDSMNNLAGEPLVERLAGGKGGGGTRLTPRGEQLVASFRQIEREHRRFVERLGRQADDYQLIRRMSMRTSARNQFLGTVTGIKPGAVNDEVELRIAGGQTLVATVTRESIESLGLAPGVEAYALVKASSVILLADGEGARVSARNRLVGSVTRLQGGAVNTEVVLELPGGGSLAAIVTRESADALGLAVGGVATAMFKASSVILAVPG
ncbi:MAG TPA: TOBE domain-containing protein [Pseudomonas sp.]|nr:TOBE domain-containing protein [Pseudomonas sp.]